jgi:hypothetical protein
MQRIKLQQAGLSTIFFVWRRRVAEHHLDSTVDLDPLTVAIRNSKNAKPVITVLIFIQLIRMLIKIMNAFIQ